MKSLHSTTVTAGKLPNSAHTDQPWYIHKITGDFRLEDVWAFDTPGEKDDFHLLIELLEKNGSPETGQGAIGKFLFALRWKLGKYFGWDKARKTYEEKERTLAKRLSKDLISKKLPKNLDHPFTPLYYTHNEYAAEIVNATVHGVMHLSWVKVKGEIYRSQMAVLVKPNGFLGKCYMVLIKPFRHLFIYPALMRQQQQKWRKYNPNPNTK